jgi:hypothetical protein
MTDQRPYGDVFDQRYHHRRTPESLAYTLVQCLEVGIMIYHLAVVHGDILPQVLGFQFTMSLAVDLTFLGDFATIQFPEVTTDGFGEYFTHAGLMLQGGFFDAPVQFGFNGYCWHIPTPFLVRGHHATILP